MYAPKITSEILEDEGHDGYRLSYPRVVCLMFSGYYFRSPKDGEAETLSS